jgi:DNA-binding CsgD family transcriptional regulator
MGYCVSDVAPSLSEGQKNCLRLVARGLSSKEIALETGLSPQTVDTYLKQAVAKLGASNRREAARMFEDLQVSQNLGSQPPAVAVEATDKSPTVPRQRSLWRLPPLGGEENDLDWQGKTLEVMRVAVIGTTVMLALTLSFIGLYQVVS